MVFLAVLTMQYIYTLQSLRVYAATLCSLQKYLIQLSSKVSDFFFKSIYDGEPSRPSSWRAWDCFSVVGIVGKERNTREIWTVRGTVCQAGKHDCLWPSSGFADSTVYIYGAENNTFNYVFELLLLFLRNSQIRCLIVKTWDWNSLSFIIQKIVLIVLICLLLVSAGISMTPPLFDSPTAFVSVKQGFLLKKSQFDFKGINSKASTASRNKEFKYILCNKVFWQSWLKMPPFCYRA